jgi:hypothetical protein
MSTIVDSFSAAAGSDHSFGGVFSVFGIGQSFTGNGAVLDYVTFDIGQYGSVPATIECQIYAHTGTYGANGSTGTGSYLAKSASYAGSSIPGGDFSTHADMTFTFSGADRITLTNGTYYVASLWVPSSDASFVITRFASGHAGSSCICNANPPGTWSVYINNNDLIFAVYGTLPATQNPIYRPYRYQPLLAQ